MMDFQAQIILCTIKMVLGAFLLFEVYFPMFLASGFIDMKETALVVKQLERQVQLMHFKHRSDNFG